MRFTWGVKVCVPEAIRKATLKISYLGVGSGFEGAVPCQVAESPSSSTQASGRSFMSKEDTKITRRVPRCVSLVYLRAAFCIWRSRVYLLCYGQYELALLLSDGPGCPLRVKLPPSWGATPLRPEMLPLLVSQKSALSSV